MEKKSVLPLVILFSFKFSNLPLPKPMTPRVSHRKFLLGITVSIMVSQILLLFYLCFPNLTCGELVRTDMAN